MPRPRFSHKILEVVKLCCRRGILRLANTTENEQQWPSMLFCQFSRNTEQSRKQGAYDLTWEFTKAKYQQTQNPLTPGMPQGNDSELTVVSPGIDQRQLRLLLFVSVLVQWCLRRNRRSDRDIFKMISLPLFDIGHFDYWYAVGFFLQSGGNL